MDNLPLLLESGNHLILLRLVHQELLTVHLGLLFDLHFTNKLILVLDFLLDCLEVLWHLTVVLFLKEVFFVISR